MTDDEFTFKDLIVTVVLPKLDAIDRKLDSKADLAVVIELSGRVETMRKEVDGLFRWRNYLAGTFAVLTLLGAIAGQAVLKHFGL